MEFWELPSQLSGVPQSGVDRQRAYRENEPGAVGRAWFGNAGMFGSAGLLGSVDIDTLVASLSTLVRQGIETSEAARVIAVGLLVNTAVKCAIALIWGTNAFRKRTALGFACIFSGLALSFVFIHR